MINLVLQRYEEEKKGRSVLPDRQNGAGEGRIPGRLLYNAYRHRKTYRVTRAPTISGREILIRTMDEIESCGLYRYCSAAKKDFFEIASESVRHTIFITI